MTDQHKDLTWLLLQDDDHHLNNKKGF
jgi:hypothetical protein